MATLQKQIDADVKAALLAGDKDTVNTLKLLKSILQNEEISKGKRDVGLTNEEVVRCLQREQKKRYEAAEMYQSNNAVDRATKERAEAELINKYLPKKLSNQELEAIVDEVIAKHGKEMARMGLIMKDAQIKVAGRASGSQIASIVKGKLQ